jgi:ankyrin repeat protein
MIRPPELTVEIPMEISNGVISSTGRVWNVLCASAKGDIETVKKMADESRGILYAQYNYTPPIHFAVREGHLQLTKYLLEQGAHDPAYKIYPFLDPLQTIARDRGLEEIASLLDAYATKPATQKFSGDNGTIQFPRTALEKEFQKAVDELDLEKTESILNGHAEFVHDDSFFWGEGILMMPAKKNSPHMVELLIKYGAKVPPILKWTQNYYFRHLELAKYFLRKGMNPNTKSWHSVTILHDMAQKGDLSKADLLLTFGADINALEEEYQSTPLGLAVRWGHASMVEFLLQKGADPNKSGADWSRPLAWAIKKGFPDIESILRSAKAE